MLHTAKLPASDRFQVRPAAERRAVLIDPLVFRCGAREGDAEVLVERSKEGGGDELTPRARCKGVVIWRRGGGPRPSRIQVRHARTRGLQLLAAGTGPITFPKISSSPRWGQRRSLFEDLLSPRTDPARPCERRAKRASHVKDLERQVH